MADQEEHKKLSRQDETVLMLVHEVGFNSRQLAEAFGISPHTALTRVAQARKHFAEMQGIPLETLRSSRGTQLTDTEKTLLDAYFEETRKDNPAVPPDFRENIFKQFPGGTANPHKPESHRKARLSDKTRALLNTLDKDIEIPPFSSETSLPSEDKPRRQWADNIEQEQQAPNKRDRC